LRAGLPLSTALDVILRSPDSRLGDNAGANGITATQGAIALIRDKIREGVSLAEAVASAAAGIHPAETAFIAAGEKTGEMEWTLKNLAEFMEAEAKLRQRVVTALIYPGIIVFLALVIAVGLLGFTVPRLTQVLSAEMNITLPLITRIMIFLGKAFVKLGPILLAMLGLLAFIAWRVTSGKPEYKIVLDRKLFGLPIIGKCYTTLAALRFTRTLALLLRGGAPLVESVNLAGRATGSPAIGAQSQNEAEAIRNGASLSEAVGRITPIGRLLSGTIQIGENSGALEQVLKSAEERFQNLWEQQLARIMAWFEPALILAVGAFVLLVVVSILLPILTLNSQLK
jgi:general secretion pathway protein F